MNVNDTTIKLMTGVRDDGAEITVAMRGTMMQIQGPWRCRVAGLSSWEWFTASPSDTIGVWWYRDECGNMRTVSVAE